MKEADEICPKNKEAWREWLELNHKEKDSVWLFFCKKSSPNFNLSWSESVDESIDFYQKVFQFKEIDNTASDSETRWLSIGEGKQLHLIPRPDSEIKINKAIHFAFSIADFDSFAQFLEDSRIQIQIGRYTEQGLPSKGWN